LGGALSSLSVLFIKNYGWREDYDITGGIGILAGILLLLVVQEPERGKLDAKPTKPVLV
jgi:hypothetical protein